MAEGTKGAWGRAEPDPRERIPTAAAPDAHPCRVQTKFNFGKSRPRICAAGAFIQWERIVE